LELLSTAVVNGKLAGRLDDKAEGILIFDLETSLCEVRKLALTNYDN